MLFINLFNPERIGKDPSGWMIAATTHVLIVITRGRAKVTAVKG